MISPIMSLFIDHNTRSEVHINREILRRRPRSTDTLPVNALVWEPLAYTAAVDHPWAFERPSCFSSPIVPYVSNKEPLNRLMTICIYPRKQRANRVICIIT